MAIWQHGSVATLKLDNKQKSSLLGAWMAANLRRSKFISTYLTNRYQDYRGKTAHSRMSSGVGGESGLIAGCEQSAAKKCPRLAAFDFDYTVVMQNTDVVIRDLLPPDKMPKDLVKLIDTKGWTQYMAEVFKLLHEHKVTPEQIRNAIRCIPEVPGLVRLLKRLKLCHNFDLIIISDSNSVFISEWLTTHGLADCIDGIYTNPAHFDDDGLLKIEPYHHQTDCRISAVNLCKGKVLEHFVIEQDLRRNLRYEMIAYVGDGNNDVCPVLRLRSEDFACARQGLALHKHIEKNREKMKLRARVLVWSSGFELLEQLQSQFTDCKTND